ncbi:hypothetical protein RJ55_08486 [Drechmeria coniospora]|nr:hypothetical protein RJ55_08486 [Drechmeria coniospora]
MGVAHTCKYQYLCWGQSAGTVPSISVTAPNHCAETTWSSLSISGDYSRARMYLYLCRRLQDRGPAPRASPAWPGTHVPDWPSRRRRATRRSWKASSPGEAASALPCLAALASLRLTTEFSPPSSARHPPPDRSDASNEHPITGPGPPLPAGCADWLLSNASNNTDKEAEAERCHGAEEEEGTPTSEQGLSLPSSRPTLWHEHRHAASTDVRMPDREPTLIDANSCEANSSLSRAILTGQTTPWRAYLDRSQLVRSQLEQSQLEQSQLEQSQLEQSQLEQSQLEQSQLEQSQLLQGRPVQAARDVNLSQEAPCDD